MKENIKVCNLAGMGCSASLGSLDLVQNSFKCHNNMLALVVTSESFAPELVRRRPEVDDARQLPFPVGRLLDLVVKRSQDEETGQVPAETRAAHPSWHERPGLQVRGPLRRR